LMLQKSQSYYVLCTRILKRLEGFCLRNVVNQSSMYLSTPQCPSRAALPGVTTAVAVSHAHQLLRTTAAVLVRAAVSSSWHCCSLAIRY
jgi:hypothetical protein